LPLLLTDSRSRSDDQRTESGVSSLTRGPALRLRAPWSAQRSFCGAGAAAGAASAAGVGGGVATARADGQPADRDRGGGGDRRRPGDGTREGGSRIRRACASARLRAELERVARVAGGLGRLPADGVGQRPQARGRERIAASAPRMRR